MQGYIVEDTVCDNSLGYVHGQFFKIKRIMVDNLVITAHDSALYVISKEEAGREEFQKIGEIDIPEDVVNKFRDYMNLKKELILITDELIAEDISLKKEMTQNANEAIENNRGEVKKYKIKREDLNIEVNILNNQKENKK